jgi:hypothetical protein
MRPMTGADTQQCILQTKKIDFSSTTLYVIIPQKHLFTSAMPTQYTTISRGLKDSTSLICTITFS